MKKKLPTPQKLPSGTWRCQVMVDGKRVSVVDDDPAVAQAKAVALKAGLVEKKASAPSSPTVGQRMDDYIESKDAILSPTTIRGYRRIRRLQLQDLMNIQINKLTQEDVQRSVNALTRSGASPKSVRNAHGLLSATLAEYRPDMVLRTRLPQKVRYEAAIPSEEDIVKIVTAAKGTEFELPILLALWLGLRASEIRGITWDSISGDVLHIKKAMVDSADGPVLKATKTYSGDRKIRVPKYLLDLINKQPHVNDYNDYVVQKSGVSIHHGFCRICEKAGVGHYRFHDLRHANASIMLLLGIPDKYSMERMGHATNNMLKTVYQHTMKAESIRVADQIDHYFYEKLHTILHTEE